jgi:hypothetical protein
VTIGSEKQLPVASSQLPVVFALVLLATGSWQLIWLYWQLVAGN